MRWAAAIATLCSACVLPRNAMIGQPASRLGAGNAEIGLSGGVAYTAPTALSSTDTGFAMLEVPHLEGNLRYGLGSAVDFNVHLSNEGLAPGVKIGLTAGTFDLAILPSVGAGLLQLQPTGAGADAPTRYFDFNAGVQLLASHASGAFASVGYRFQYVSNTSDSTTATSTALTAHSVSASFGWTFSKGPLRIRPEVAGMLATGITSIDESGSAHSSSVLLTIMPGVTFAMSSGR